MAITPEQYYESCNLKYNPFRSNPTLENDPRVGVWIGYEKEQRQLWKFIERSRADQVGNTNFLMLYGDLGTGKSHALLWAQHQILEARKAEFNAVAYYVQTLRKDGKISFASAFRDDILSKSSLVADVRRFKQFLEEVSIEYKKDNGLGPDVSTDEALKKVIGAVALYNFARNIVRCDTEDQVRALLDPPKGGDFQAMITLSNLVNLFGFEINLKSGKRRFKNAAYLFIDELDLLATASAKEARDVNELLRHLYDNCPTCFCLVLAFTATAAELNILFANYVLSRVNKQIVMDFLELNEAKQFIKGILDTARVTKGKKSGYFPFEESTIEGVVSHITSITPRKVINAMQEILEEVRLKGYDPSKKPISMSFLEEEGIVEDVLGG
jgi:hypothetical protein